MTRPLLRPLIWISSPVLVSFPAWTLPFMLLLYPGRQVSKKRCSLGPKLTVNTHRPIFISAVSWWSASLCGVTAPARPLLCLCRVLTTLPCMCGAAAPGRLSAAVGRVLGDGDEGVLLLQGRCHPADDVREYNQSRFVSRPRLSCVCASASDSVCAVWFW